jgi:hypothetical protein
MWIILGNKVRSERVPNGRKAEHHCGACGETAVFYERQVTESFQLYFINVFNYQTQRAMACGACGALYATDELGAPREAASAQQGTVFGALQSAMDSIGHAIDRAGDAIEKGVREVVSDVRAEPPAPPRRAPAAPPYAQPPSPPAPVASAQPSPPRPPAPADIPLDDPLAEEDRALEARFAELERKARERAAGGDGGASGQGGAPST